MKHASNDLRKIVHTLESILKTSTRHVCKEHKHDDDTDEWINGLHFNRVSSKISKTMKNDLVCKSFLPVFKDETVANEWCNAVVADIGTYVDEWMELSVENAYIYACIKEKYRPVLKRGYKSHKYDEYGHRIDELSYDTQRFCDTHRTDDPNVWSFTSMGVLHCDDSMNDVYIEISSQIPMGAFDGLDEYSHIWVIYNDANSQLNIQLCELLSIKNSCVYIKFTSSNIPNNSHIIDIKPLHPADTHGDDNEEDEKQ